MITRPLYLLLGDERCAEGMAPTIAKLCGTGIGRAFEPSPAICAAIATILISIAPLAFLPFLPTPDSPAEKTRALAAAVQPSLLCFACGGMLGDVFLHILPHTFGGGHAHHGHEEKAHHGHDHDHHGHDHDHHGHDHDHHSEHGHAHGVEELQGGLAVLAGFMLFFLVEKVVRAHSSHAHDHDAQSTHSHGHAHEHAPTSHGHDHDAHGGGAHDGHDCCGHDHDSSDGGAHAHEHGHASHGDEAGVPQSPGGKASGKGGLRKRRAASPKKSKPTAAAATVPASPKSEPAPATLAPSTTAAAAAMATQHETLISGYLNLAADAAHNFTDGLLLGGAFSQGFMLGVTTTLAVLMHEVPHEVGDVAILMQAGFTKLQAIRAQLGTAVAAMLGTAVAVYTGKTQANLLSSFTAGGFVYVATVDVLPPLLREPSSLLGTLVQLGAMALGVGMMVIVAAFE